MGSLCFCLTGSDLGVCAAVVSSLGAVADLLLLTTTKPPNLFVFERFMLVSGKFYFLGRNFGSRLLDLSEAFGDFLELEVLGG